MKEKNKDLEWILDRNESDKLTGTKVKTKRTSNLLKKPVIIGGVLFSLVLGGLTGCSNTNDNSIVAPIDEETTYEYAPGFVNIHEDMTKIDLLSVVSKFEDYIIVDSQNEPLKIVETGRRSDYKDEEAIAKNIFSVRKVWRDSVAHFIFQIDYIDPGYDFIHDEEIPESIIYDYSYGANVVGEYFPEIAETFKFIDETTMVVDLHAFRLYEEYSRKVKNGEEAEFPKPRNESKINEHDIVIRRKGLTPQSNNEIPEEKDYFEGIVFNNQETIIDVLKREPFEVRLESYCNGGSGDIYYKSGHDSYAHPLCTSYEGGVTSINKHFVEYEDEGETKIILVRIDEEELKNGEFEDVYHDWITGEEYEYEKINFMNHKSFFNKHKVLLELAVYDYSEGNYDVYMSTEMIKTYNDYLSGEIKELPIPIKPDNTSSYKKVKVKTLI